MLNPAQFVGKAVFVTRGSKILGPLRIHSHEVERPGETKVNKGNTQEWHTIWVGEGGKHGMGVNPANMFETREDAEAHVSSMQEEERKRFQR